MRGEKLKHKYVSTEKFTCSFHVIFVNNNVKTGGVCEDSNLKGYFLNDKHLWGKITDSFALTMKMT